MGPCPSGSGGGGGSSLKPKKPKEGSEALLKWREGESISHSETKKILKKEGLVLDQSQEGASTFRFRSTGVVGKPAQLKKFLEEKGWSHDVTSSKEVKSDTGPGNDVYTQNGFSKGDLRLESFHIEYANRPEHMSMNSSIELSRVKS